MKTFLAAYYPDYDGRQLGLAFSIMVTDEVKTVTALRALSIALPALRWSQREPGAFGLTSKQITPKPPFHFLRSAFPADKK